MHDTHLPLWKWFLADYMIVESKKAVSAYQIKRMIDVSYKTPWYLYHRIRNALLCPDTLLSGVVEIDETYVGPKVKGKEKGNWKGEKQDLMGAKERYESVVIESAEKADKVTLREFLQSRIGHDVTSLFSDDSASYPGSILPREYTNR